MYKRNLYQQLRLMIKPPYYIIQITQALTTLLNGIITTSKNDKINFDWQYIKECLKNTNEILSIVNDHDAFQKKCIFKNYENSREILNSISPLDNSSNNETFQIIKETLERLYLIMKDSKIQQEKIQISKENEKVSSKQFSGSNFRKQLSQRSTSFVQKYHINEKNNQSRPKSQQTNYSISSRSSSNKKDSKIIVQLTETKNQSRLNKILNLKTSFPNNRSNVKQFINNQYSYNNSSRSNSKESIQRSGNDKNQSLILRIKLQDYQMKWELDRDRKSKNHEELKKSGQKKYKQQIINNNINQNKPQLKSNTQGVNQKNENSIKKILKTNHCYQKSKLFIV
ncbi:unnamed protein product [Paramecium pentaurelia]|uniref:Uncharacterized protein n=1 Tax=Paramecium pentaurelia TaxID=43138 RepID=A0A8S1YBF3_9CILI|nr:unnamed protein product [Paramecium pentaurelia]